MPMLRQAMENDSSTTLPSALVVGPQKAGTTWIHMYLADRPDVYTTQQVKETFFFDRYYHRGLRWYRQHFTVGYGQTARVVEVAPTYFHNSLVAERILCDLGAVPILCTLRDPVERAVSLYQHLRRYGRVTTSLRRAVRKYPEIVEASCYARHLSTWYELFGTQYVTCMFLETLAENPEKYARMLSESLDLPKRPLPEKLRQPVNGATQPKNLYLAKAATLAGDALRFWGMYSVVEIAKKAGLKQIVYGRPGCRASSQVDSEDCRWLYKQFAADIDELEQMLSIDLSTWRRH